jgi:cytochrome oxidase Cu insertion factor (SCO1/SenC/PrrC family)
MAGDPIRRRAAIVVATLLAILVAGCDSVSERETPTTAASSTPVVQPGEMAPDFSLPQAIGKPIPLSDLRGRPVLLYFSMGPG